ncbi:hypothetical protein BDU57DRAFT_515990, partial [Ampelomyces quisqualis]
MGDTLEERLKSHAKAFEGLMSLIPAKDYYGKDESITSVSSASPRGVGSALISCCTDTMAKKDEADPRRATGSQARET